MSKQIIYSRGFPYGAPLGLLPTKGNLMKATKCPQCKGNVSHTSGGFPTSMEHSIFVCTRCDWISPDGFQHEPTKRQQLWPKRKPVKKQRQQLDPPELVKAIRVEARKRMAELVALRKTMPKNSSKLTTKQREKLHALSFSVLEIRDELGA